MAKNILEMALTERLFPQSFTTHPYLPEHVKVPYIKINRIYSKTLFLWD